MNKDARPIAAGMAKGGTNYTAEINIPKIAKRLYVRQTDPKQRKEVYEFAAPENGGIKYCKLYYSGSNTRAEVGSTTAADAAPVGMNAPEDPDYQEDVIFANIPSVSVGAKLEWGSLNFDPNGKFIITEDYTDTNPFTANIGNPDSGRASVYVKGTWKVTQGINWQNLDIYVLNGGTIRAEEYPVFGGTTNIYIATGGKIESLVDNLQLNCGEIINFGSITGKDISSLKETIHNTQQVYNAGNIEANRNFTIINRTLINKGTISIATGKFDLTDSDILNKAQITTYNLKIIGCVVNNYGELLFDENNGILETNNTAEDMGIVNHYGATLKGYRLSGGLSLYNDGFVELSFCENGSKDYLYNSCTLIIKEKFTFGTLILDKGSITGGKPDNLNSSENNSNLWKPVPFITNNGSPMTFILKNGSVIKATTFEFINSPNTITGEGGDPSLLQIGNIRTPIYGLTTLSGNLVLELAEACNDPNWKAVGIPTTGWDESKYTFSTCGEYYKPGNPGNPEPVAPELPIITDETTYTYAFEDNWPIYGDFDMNDIVVSIDKTTTVLYSEGSVKTYTLEGTLQAVGASKKLGLGVRFQALNATNFVGVKGLVQGTTNNSSPLSLEANQSKPVIIICNDAHRFMGNAENDRNFINTVPGSTGNTDGAPFEISIEFREGTVTPDDVIIKNLDMFVIAREADSKSKRTEIHVIGYSPTDLGSTTLFGTGNDESSVGGPYYSSFENLAWGWVIPAKFAWPSEHVNIKGVYSNFVSWVQSKGDENQDWYENHNGQVYTK